MTPSVLILRAPGTNCDLETAHAFERAGARPTSMHINAILESPDRMNEFQILCIPGGFSYGDDIAAGRILASQLRNHLGDAVRQFKDDGKLILGICNGFQVLIKAGVLLPDTERGEPATLTWNSIGRFQDRWIYLTANSDRCVFLRGIEGMYLPIAHAEGKFVPQDEHLLTKLEGNDQLALLYSPEPTLQRTAKSNGTGHAELEFPINPNGSIGNVAGVCDETGRVFGLMPHPERYVDRVQHPRWTRGEGRDPGDGLAVFRNAVKYFAN